MRNAECGVEDGERCGGSVERSGLGKSRQVLVVGGGAVEVLQEGVGYHAGGVVVGNEIGVDDQMIEEGVIEVSGEVLFQVTPTGAIFLTDDFKGGFAVDLSKALDVGDASWEGGYQADVKGVVQSAGDDIGAAANEDDVALLGEA